MAFHPYPQLIPSVFNLSGFGPPHALTRASTWPWVDHPASGLDRATHRRPFGLALATASPHGLTSRHGANSQAHSSIGTPSPTGALTACERPVSGTVSLPSRGTFHHSLTVLVRYRSPGSIQAAKWSWQIHTGFHGPRATRERAHTAGTVSPTGLSPTTAPLPRGFGYRTSFSLRPAPAGTGKARPTTPRRQPLPGATPPRFNHPPLSLATTHGISSPTGTEMFHFPA